MSRLEEARPKKPLAIVCDSEASFQAYLAWKGLTLEQAVKCSSDYSAKEYVKAHGKPTRRNVVILPVNKVPPGVLPALGYKRRPDVPKKGAKDEPPVVPGGDSGGDPLLES